MSAAEEPASSTQTERTERSTRALLDAAAELIVEGGFDALTFAKISERAGYSRGLVTARFGSKEALLTALIDRTVDRWNDRKVAPRTRGRPGLEGVLLLLDAIKIQAQTDPRGQRVLWTLMFEALGSDPALRHRFATFHDGFRADVARALGEGRRDGSVRRDVDTGLEAALIIGGLRGIAYQWLLDPDFPLVAALEHLHDTTATRIATDTPQEDQ